MLLAIDVGNTETAIGVFEDAAGLSPAPAAGARRSGEELSGLVQHWRVATEARRTPDEHFLQLASMLSLSAIGLPSREQDQAAPEGTRLIEGVALSSSVPAVTGALRDMAQRWLKAPLVIVEPGIRTGMPILYDPPKDVGADRIVNAVAAIELYGAPAIVVDLGTATTFDAISPAGEYLGGAIVPGVEISMNALFTHAAALRRVELVQPRAAIGRSTVESMQSGAIFGYAGLVDGLCTRFLAELGPATVIATGGLSGLIAPHASCVEHLEPWLTLHGLRLLYQRNVGEAASK